MRILLIPAPSIAAALDSVVARLHKNGVEVTLGSTADLHGGSLADIEVIVGPGALSCDAALFDRTPRLRGLVSIGSGCEGFDRAAAARRGIAIRTGTTRETIAGMAGATILLMLALCHDLAGAEAAHHSDVRRDLARARTLDNLVVGLVGYGAIAREVARRLRLWDVHVLATSPSRHSGKADGVHFVPLDALLAESDVVSLHAALNEQSHHLLDRRSLARLKPNALLVNTARGGLIDEAALAEALARGALGGAAIDCFETEPLPLDSPLRTAPNIILTPHQIGHTAAGAASITGALVGNIMSFARSVEKLGSKKTLPA